MQQFLGDSDSAMLYLEAHRLTLAIAKKMLHENHFKTAQKPNKLSQGAHNQTSYPRVHISRQAIPGCT